MQVIQNFEGFRVTLLRPLYCISFRKFVALFFLRAGQVTFPAALNRMRLSSFLLYGLHSPVRTDFQSHTAAFPLDKSGGSATQNGPLCVRNKSFKLTLCSRVGSTAWIKVTDDGPTLS
jgi:hypothetical protein